MPYFLGPEHRFEQKMLNDAKNIDFLKRLFENSTLASFFYENSSL